MQNLTTGQFFGTTNETIQLNGLTITDTEYTHEKVDWHYHENPYFTFILQGNVIEGCKNVTYHCAAGSLLFHNWHEAHYNIKPKGFTRGFHIELEKEWLNSFDINMDKLQGNINLTDPAIKALMYHIFRESKMTDAQPLGIDALLVKLFNRMAGEEQIVGKNKPHWVNRLKELLNDTTDNCSLHQLAQILNIHPVHLSRDFSKYFNCNLGDYIRAIRVQQALTLLPDSRLSLTEIALQCNFADQSHFIRTFKSQYQLTPSQYRQLLQKRHGC